MDDRETLRPDGPTPWSADATPVPSGTPALGDAATVWAAGFWRRLLAGMIDAAIVLPLVVAVMLSASKLAGLDLPPVGTSGLDTWLDLILAGDAGFLGASGLGLVVILVYLLLFQTLGSRTIGMRVLHLDIIDLRGMPLSPWRAGLRTVAYLASLATLGLGFVWIGFDRERRGLHDWLAGTLVTRPAPRSSE